MIPILLLLHDSTTNNSVKMFLCNFFSKVSRKEGGRHGGKLLKLHLIQQAVQGGEGGRRADQGHTTNEDSSGVTFAAAFGETFS